MAKFGVDGITYEDSDDYPSEEGLAVYGFALIEVDDRDGAHLPGAGVGLAGMP